MDSTITTEAYVNVHFRADKHVKSFELVNSLEVKLTFTNLYTRPPTILPTTQITMQLICFFFRLRKSVYLFNSRLRLHGQKGEMSESAKRRKMKRYSQVFVIFIDVIQLQNVRVLD